MELRPPPAALLARDRLQAAAFGRGQDAEAFGQVDQLVEVIVEHPRPLAEVAEAAVALDDLDLELADLGLGRVLDATPGEAPEQLHARADAEHGPAAGAHDLAQAIERGRVVRRPGGSRAGDHDRLRLAQIARLEVGDDLDPSARGRLQAALEAGTPPPGRQAALTRMLAVGLDDRVLGHGASLPGHAPPLLTPARRLRPCSTSS